MGYVESGTRQPGPDRIVELLRQALMVEHTFVVYFPQVAERLADRKLAKKLTVLIKESTLHAEAVSRALRDLGREPPPVGSEPLESPLALQPFFRRLLEKEKLALWLYNQAAPLCNAELAAELGRYARMEAAHVKLVEDILAGLP